MSRLACGPAALAVALLVGSACGAGVSPKPSPVNVATYLDNDGRTAYFAGERLPATGNPAEPTVRWTANAPGSISSQPVVTGGLVYWGSWDGYEHASTTSGAAVWSTALGRATDDRCSPPSAGVAGTPTVEIAGGRSILYVAGGNADFFALDARTGSVVWKTALGSAPAEFIWGSAALYGNLLYVGVSAFGECTPSPGRLVQMDAATGSVRHVFEVVPRGCTGGGIWGSPAVDIAAGIVFIATGDADSIDCSQPTPYAQAVLALRASDLGLVGSWQVALKDRVPDGDFGTTPTLFTAPINGQPRALVGMANKNGTYYTFDRTRISQGPVWQVVIARGGSCPYCGDGSIASSAFDGGQLYVGGGATTIGGMSCAGSLRALDPATGVAIWQKCLTSGPVLAGVVSTPDLVLAGSGPELIGAASGSGQLQYKFTDPDPTVAFLAPVWIAGGVVYAGTSHGTLYALGAKP